MYLPWWSLHRSVRIFHCAKHFRKTSCVGSLRTSDAFASIVSTLLNRVFLSSDEKLKKSHKALCRGETADVPIRLWRILRRTTMQTKCNGLAHCSDEASICTINRVFVSCSRRAVKTSMSIDGSSSQHGSLLHPNVKENGHHCFEFWFTCFRFFLPRPIRRALPVHRLTPCFRIVDEKPRFLTSSNRSV